MKKYLVVLKVFMSDVSFIYTTIEIQCLLFSDVSYFVDDYIRDFDLFPDRYDYEIFQVTRLYE